MARWVTSRVTPTRAGAGDRGAASLEYTGVLLVVAVVVAAVSAAFLVQATQVGERAAYAICRLITVGQSGCGSPTGDPDPLVNRRVPTDPCVVSTNSVSTNREVAVMVVTAKDGRSFEVAKLSDGSYRVTRITSGGIGAEAGVGAGVTLTVDDTRFGGSLGAEAGTGLEFTAGEVYYAKDSAGLKRLLDEELEDTVEDGLLGDGPARWLWEGGQDVTGAITGNEDYEFGTPDEVYAEGGVVVNASAEATSLVNSATGNVAQSEGLGVRTTKDGKTTVYLKTNAKGAAALQQLGVDAEGLDFIGAGGAGELELLTAVTFDRTGEMIEVSTQATAAGGSKGVVSALFNGNPDGSLTNTASGVTVFQAVLPIKDAIDRGLGLSFLAASGVNQLSSPQGQLLTGPVSTPALAGLRQAAADRGTVTQQHLTSDGSTPFAVEAAGKLEVELGLSADVRTKSLTSTGGEYWDGSAWQTWEGCAA